MSNFKKMAAAGIVTLLLAACAKPLPPERRDYVGEWRGGPIALVILAEGRVVYQRKEGGMSKKVDAPLKEFKGDNFVVGIGFMSTEFAVSAPPHEDGGVWKMTVDGVELTRITADPQTVENSDSTST